LQHSNYSCVTTLSTGLLVIVNFSVTATCVYHFVLETEHFRGHGCRNSGHTIANMELRTERH